ncbi:MAG: T9SS type A sorting domain-containing protein [bacterium]
MEKRILLVLFLLGTSFIFAQNGLVITNLSGFESPDGHTQLVYGTEDGIGWGQCSVISYNYYHFNTFNQTDSVIFMGGRQLFFPGEETEIVKDFGFFNNDPQRHMHVLQCSSYDPDGRLYRYNSEYPVFWAFVMDGFWIDKNKQNMCYLAADYQIFVSSDSGLTWPGPNYAPIGIPLSFDYIGGNPYHAGMIFGEENMKLCKSVDTGKTNIVVEGTYGWRAWNTKMFFNNDNLHMYALSDNTLFVSANGGEPNTWQQVQTFDAPVSISIDNKVPGLVYIAGGRKLYKSTNYGVTFTQIKEFEKIIKGIYKKPLMDCLYIAFASSIVKLSNTGLEIVNQKSVRGFLSMLPLKVGNRWFYNNSGYNAEYINGQLFPIYFSGNYELKILEKSTINNLWYYKFSDSSYIRIDSTAGKVFKKSNYSADEHLIYNLTAVDGDFYFCEDGYRLSSVREKDTVMFDDLRRIKLFNYESLSISWQKLVQGIGLLSQYESWDFGECYTTLKGCVINSIVYGDTTLVSVKEGEHGIAANYELSQNYPNPFNPSTVINYQVAESGLVSLKVYDILGKEIATLINEEKAPGAYQVTFNAKTANNSKELSSGVYFYTLKTGNFTRTKKMILVR